MEAEKVADDAYEFVREIALQYPNKKITNKGVAEQMLSSHGLYICKFIDKDVLLEIPAVVVQAAKLRSGVGYEDLPVALRNNPEVLYSILSSHESLFNASAISWFIKYVGEELKHALKAEDPNILNIKDSLESLIASGWQAT